MGGKDPGRSTGMDKRRKKLCGDQETVYGKEKRQQSQQPLGWGEEDEEGAGAL